MNNAILMSPGTAAPGEEFNTYSTRRYPLGTLLVTHDGRQFRFTKNGAVAAVPGSLYQSPVPGANFDQLVLPAAVPIGTRTFNITNGATTITKDQFAGGYLNVEDDTGEGRAYLIESNDAEAAGSADFAITLAGGHGVKLALTTATTVGLTAHPLDAVIIHPSPATARLVGVAVSAIPASNFGWLQVRGPASVLTQGTLVINERCVDSASADGAVTPVVLTEGTPNADAGQYSVGTVMEVAATTEHSLIYLDIG